MLSTDKKLMKCKLCLQEKKLLKKSHIIPDFMYDGMYNQFHKLVNINLSKLEEKRFTNSGIYDKEILCAHCDNSLLSKLETYASNCIYFRGGEKARSHIRVENLTGTDIIPALRLHNLDYGKTKLFFLSILWRAHISNHDFFNDVSLGIHAERIRIMLLNQNPGDDDQYEIVMMIVDTKGSRPDKSVISPVHLKMDGNSMYIFHINQIMYHFNISRYNKLSLYDKGAIRRDGIMDVGILTDEIARTHFDMYMGRKILMKSNIIY